MPGDPGTPLREHGDALLAAAREMARALDDGAAAPAAATRLARAARELAAWADTFAAPAPASAPVAAPAPPRIPARDETGTEEQPRRRPPRTAKESARDDSAPAPAPARAGAGGIEPRPQKLPKKKAQAVVDAAELVRDPEHRENHRWILRSGDTVLGYVQPSYGGVSRSGRNGWISRLGGHPGPRCKSRDGAAMDLAASWMRLVTATPKRTITG